MTHRPMPDSAIDTLSADGAQGPELDLSGLAERAPAYAGHQEHACPVCLNVHGGEAAEPAPRAGHQEHAERLPFAERMTFAEALHLAGKAWGLKEVELNADELAAYVHALVTGTKPPPEALAWATGDDSPSMVKKLHGAAELPEPTRPDPGRRGS